MADQKITALTELAEADVASTDVLPIADVSASETKKVTVKNVIVDVNKNIIILEDFRNITVYILVGLLVLALAMKLFCYSQ